MPSNQLSPQISMHRNILLYSKEECYKIIANVLGKIATLNKNKVSKIRRFKFIIIQKHENPPSSKGQCYYILNPPLAAVRAPA